MIKNKYDFIKELLEDNKLNLNQRVRILMLASKEIGVEGKLEDRVQKIEEIILQNGIKEQEQSAENSSNHTPQNKYIDPKKLYDALFAFNQNPVLKTTCHPMSSANIEYIASQLPDNTYNFEKHLELIKSNFKSLSKRYNFTTKMYSLINNYISGYGVWSSQNITFSWSSTELTEWCKSNPMMCPNPEDSVIETTGNEGYFLQNPFNSKFTNNSIETLNDLVLFFKSLWHIKFDNPLQKILEKRNKEYDLNQSIKLYFENFSQSINLYTDVDKLVQAYAEILKLIKENNINTKPEVVVSFYENGTSKILTIKQLHTYWKKSISDTIERPFGNSMTPIIVNQINGLCDLYIKARFEDKQVAIINLWDGKTRKKTIIPESDFEGIEYQLILKK
jgi:hypothetical protein